MPACINDGPQWGCCCWWPRCQITGVDVHRSSPISIEWRQQPSTAKVPAASAVSRQADFSSVFKSRSETMRLERKTLAMDHLSASHVRFDEQSACLRLSGIYEAIHRSNSHLDHRKAGEEGGTLGGASNKKRWWKKISTLFFELAPKNGTTFLRGGRESENEHHIQLCT